MSSGWFSQRPVAGASPVIAPFRDFLRPYSSQYPMYVYPDRAVRTVATGIICTNIAVFGLWQWAAYNRDQGMLRKLTDNATLSWRNVKEGRYWTILTSAFSHQNLAHIFFNMFTLYSFGSLVSIVPGISGLHMLTLSLGSAVAGSLAFLQNKRQPGPAQSVLGGRLQMQDWRSALGASGLVMGLGAAAACLRPFQPVYLFLIPIPIPLWVVTVAYAAVDSYYVNSASPIGHSAHLGGAIFGVIYYFSSLRRFGGVWQMLRHGTRR